MGEQEFRSECDRVLTVIEDALDRAPFDVDTERNAAVLRIEFGDGSQIIVSGNTPLCEIWVAAKSGGFHYKRAGDRWVDTRTGEELFAGLSRAVSAQAATPIIVADTR